MRALKWISPGMDIAEPSLRIANVSLYVVLEMKFKEAIASIGRKLFLTSKACTCVLVVKRSEKFAPKFRKIFNRHFRFSSLFEKMP